MFLQTIAAVKDARREGELYEQFQALRERVEAFIACDEPLPNMGRDEAIDRAITTIGSVMELVGSQTSVLNGDAGHGPGHWCRDFSHALRLAHDPAMASSVVLSGMVAGTLHDLGTVLLDRYADRTRAVRHAEAGALIVREAALTAGVLTPFEADLTAYAIAAHTHYLAEQNVVCADGIERMVRPFVDMRAEAPFMPVWFPRWADRLDCNGPCFIGRHYLTLHRDHHDYGKASDESVGRFYKVSYVDHMRPILRSAAEIKAAGGQRTFVEHAHMFAGSQSNASPYGKYDRGDMVMLRDEYRSALERILDRIVRPAGVKIEETMVAWTIFLGTNIEPSELGRSAAAELDLGFSKLDPRTQQAWASGFRTVLDEYRTWSARRLAFLDAQPAAHLRLPGIAADIRDWIRPSSQWSSVLSS